MMSSRGWDSAMCWMLAGCMVISMAACGDETSMLPKPRAYPRVLYPSGSELSFAVEVCPFTFKYPSYASIVRDSTYFDGKPIHPCWFDLVTPDLNGRVHFSYYPITDLASFERFRDDAFDLAGKHNIVADYIEEQAISRRTARVEGFSFSLDGNVASPFQFYVSDSTHHFLRGALYVNAKAQADSLAPIYDFLQADLDQIIETLEWK